MPQISLYVDEKTLKKVETAAKRKNLSISKWVAEQIRSRTEPVYPDGFEELFGSIDDGLLEKPEEIDFSFDSRREIL